MLAVIQRRGPAQELRATIDRLPLHVRQAVLAGINGQRIIAGAHADASGGVCPMVAADVHVPWKTVSDSSVATAQEAARAWDRYAEASGSSRAATKRQLLALTSMLEVSILNETSQGEMPLGDAIAEYERARAGLPRYAPLVRDTAPAVPVGHTRYLSLADAYEVVPDESPSRFEAPRERPSHFEAPAERPTPVEVPVPERQSPLEVSAEPARAIEVAADPPRPVEEVPAARPRKVQPRKRRNTGENDRTAELQERDGWAWMRPFRSYDEYEETLLRALAEIDSHERELELLRVR
jgi:hypothetical protein